VVARRLACHNSVRSCKRGRDRLRLPSPARWRRSIVFSGPPDRVPRSGSACALPKREFGRHVIVCLIVRLSRNRKVEQNYRDDARIGAIAARSLRFETRESGACRSSAPLRRRRPPGAVHGDRTSGQDFAGRSESPGHSVRDVASHLFIHTRYQATPVEHPSHARPSAGPSTALEAASQARPAS